MYKTFLKISFLFILAFFSIGCTQFFFNDEKPKTIQENSNISSQEQNEIQPISKIKGFNNITPGTIWDLCSKGKHIAISRKNHVELDPPSESRITNNLALYNLKKGEIQNITSSSVDLLFSQFDANETGIYYLESKEESIFQLYWFDITNNTKVKVSSSDHQVTPSFYVRSNNQVYYGTKDGKIIRASKNNVLTTIDIGSEYYIQQVYYYEDENLLLFSAFEEGFLNLYSLDPSGQNLTKVVTDINGYFNMSERENKILYSTPIPDSNKSILWLYDLVDKENIELLEGYPQKSIISPAEDKVAYLDRSGPNSNLQSIWVLDLASHEKEQIASNLKITSELFWHPKGNKLFFSVCESKDNQLQSTVYSLDFKN